MDGGIMVAEVGGRGRGVVAVRRIPAGQIIERTPVIVLPDPEWRRLEETALRDYYFAWGTDAAAVALGFGSLYNHRYQPNATYEKHEQERLLVFRALREIRAGEEITVNYHGGSDCQDALWFQVEPEP